ncbi:ubiquitin ligase (cullin) of SCF [Coemansia sp. RSA 1286]|nr:ubiquitin ligase (cullin) of SCF [Coemansia sp. RSA 485]KAJ2635842.1 ubiquitin ligase (cullin) of SCF [Coemansia sp. RSA 1286]
MANMSSSKDIKEVWQYLQTGFNEMFAVYTLCTAESQDIKKLSGGCTNHTSAGETVYYLVVNIIKEHLKNVGTLLSSLSGTELIETYIKQWEKNTNAVKYAKNIFSYLSRHCIARMNEEGNEVVSIADLFPKHWLTEVVPKVGAKVSVEIQKLVDQKRQGMNVPEIGLVKAVAESYDQIQEACKYMVASGDKIFKTHFLNMIVKDAAAFYKPVASSFCDEMDAFAINFETEIWVKQEKQIATDILGEKHIAQYKELLLHTLQ